MTLQDLLLLVTVMVALGFDFTNGFHDTANAIATSVSTRALSPRLAVGLSAVLNLIGAFAAIKLLHTHVANTVGSLISPKVGVSLGMIIAALGAAIIWNLITWRSGLPSSSSHALIGGLLGMGIAAYGTGAVEWAKLGPVVVGLVTSPIAGLALAYAGMIATLHLFRHAHPGRANRGFRRVQVLSGSVVSLAHGANDAQKTMGIITLALLATHHIAKPKTGFPDPPDWVVFGAACAMGLGTYVGGWRIIRTVGSRIIRMEPVDGFMAQTAAAVVLVAATELALPVSTTHVISGSVMGAGATRRAGAIRWGIARNILVAWILTIPATAAVAAAAALLVRLLGG